MYKLSVMSLYERGKKISLRISHALFKGVGGQGEGCKREG